jgi:hypothetical protein
MSDSRDIKHGVNDPVHGVDVKRRPTDPLNPRTERNPTE